MGDSKRKNADSLESTFSWTGRGRRTRTLNKGFGDPRVTITPCPYVLSNRVYYTGILRLCQYPSLISLQNALCSVC